MVVGDWRIIKYFLISLVTSALSLNLILDIYSYSPTYTRIDVDDFPGHDFYLKQGDDQYSSPYSIQDELPKDVQKIANNLNDLGSVDYVSDGKNINVTFWLDRPFEESPSTHIPIYIALIDVDADPITGGSLGIDYRAKVLWNNDTKTWERIIEEVSTDERNRILNKIDNYTDFFHNSENESILVGKNYYPEPCCYVSIAIDMKFLNYPNQYLIYSSLINSIPFTNENYYVVDTTKKILIPQPAIHMTSRENPIVMRKDETRIIPIQINSTSFLQTQVNLASQYVENIAVDITPKVVVPPKGSIDAFVTVKSVNNSQIGSYQIPIVASAQIFQEGKLGEIGSFVDLRTTKINLLLEVKDYPFSEWLNDKLKELSALWKDNTQFIILIIGIFLTPFGAWIFGKITKKRKIRKKQLKL